MTTPNERYMKPLSGRNELLIYLDYDGVLHHENVFWKHGRGVYLSAPSDYTLFQHAPLLEELLEPYPEVKIVLSTSWVPRFGYSKAAKRLPPVLRSKVVGATFHSGMDGDSFGALPRGRQVWADVERRGPRDWLALDDDYVDWPAWCLRNFVRTHETEGISEPVVLAELKLKLSVLGSK